MVFIVVVGHFLLNCLSLIVSELGTW